MFAPYMAGTDWMRPRAVTGVEDLALTDFNLNDIDRLIPLTGGCNFRDVGGYPAEGAP